MPATENGKVLTLEKFAIAKRLPVEFLREHGVAEVAGGIQFKYRDEAGDPIACKRRTALAAKEGSYWPKGVPVAAYGQDQLHLARRAGTLNIVEGESDTLTLWFHQIPALGIPGAKATKCLQADHLVGITRIFIVREPDNGGKLFLEGMQARLREIGWDGTAFQLTMPEGIKDPSELHLHHRNCAAFKSTWHDRERAATLVELEPQWQGEDDIDGIALPPASPWPALRPEALYGITGEIVETIAPETEADPVGLLMHLLVASGNIIGRTAHSRVGGDKHYCNLFAMPVGKSSLGRKGVAWGHMCEIMELAVPDWIGNNTASGLTSGVGLIMAVRDSTVKKNAEGETEIVDEGVPDKRKLVIETEFGQVLRNLKRDSNDLSAVLRNAWDGRNLSTLTKSPWKATGAHISIVGHITPEELHRYIEQVDLFNGFANRFLWFLVRRSKSLPEGGRRLDLLLLGKRLHEALTGARRLGELKRADETRELWASEYERLNEPGPGLGGVVTSRAPAQVLRLSTLYAALDASPFIRPAHLHAALSIWDYCQDSARIIFGSEEHLDPLTKSILAKLISAGEKGLTRTEIRNALNRNVESEKIVASLGKLLEKKKARFEKEKTGKRQAERWYFMTPLRG